jgi:membrane-bound inhibitor of C-type lysozyme
MRYTTALTILVLLLTPSLASASQSGQLDLTTAGEFSRLDVTYNCAAEGPLKVTYVNADPNFLAVVPVSGEAQPLVFASVLSGSGTRYAAGKYIWWSTGNSGTLSDTTQGDNAEPMMTCTAIH